MASGDTFFLRLMSATPPFFIQPLKKRVKVRYNKPYIHYLPAISDVEND